MKMHRFEVPGLAHFSYILESDGAAVVVDPKRDIDTYLTYATDQGLDITHVLETHIHADFASGATALANAANAELWLSSHDAGEHYQYSFPHVQFREGNELRIGDLRLSALHTPGHTPEHLSFLVRDESRGTCPLALLSGDFVFVGSFGRPDLLGEDAKHALAAQLFDSVHQKIGSLPDGAEIHPAHGAGSMCGAGLAKREQSTLGYERACNRWFNEPSKQRFVHHVLTDVPPFPEYYRRMKSVNAAGPAIFDRIPGDQALTASEFRARWQGNEAIVIDLRSPDEFGAGHIPGAFSIGEGPLLSVWAAWVVPYDVPIMLAGNEFTNYDEARRALVRVGLDNIIGYLQGGMKAWLAAGYELSHAMQIPVAHMHELLERGAYLLDVRGDPEWNEGHVPGAHHLFAGYIPSRLKEIPTDRPVFSMCGGGYRSSVVVSLLQRAGIQDISNVVGGMNAWKSRNLPVVSPEPSDTASDAARVA